MLKIVLAVDGSESSLNAVTHMIKRALAAKDGYQIELVNVQHPLHGDVTTFVDSALVKQYHHEQGMKELAAAREKLDAAGVAYQHHLFVGEPATVIARYAKDCGCDEIVLGTHGHTALAGLFMGSVSTKVVHLAEVPVLLVK